MAKDTIAFEVIETLRDIGVRHVFGVPSGGWVDYMEALRTTDGIDFVLTSHEGGASFMADICGRITGSPGVCFGTFGPGATNLTTGVGSAYLDRSPMIALSDEMPATMRGRVTQMGIDHQALFRPITKNTTRLEAGNVKKTLIEAAECAMSGRPGPVHIGLPVGLSAEQAGDDPFVAPEKTIVPAASASAVDAMLKAFAQSKKPIIAAGLGAVHAGVGQQIKNLAEKHNLPVVLTPMAKGMLAESHPSYAGILFHALSDMVAETHREADMVLAVGYDPVEFNFESWLREDIAVVNIDIEPIDIDTKQYEVAVDVQGDISATLDHLLAAGGEPKNWDIKAIEARKQEMFSRMQPENAHLGPCKVLDILREALPEDGIMACDVGAHTHLIGQKWPTPAPGRQIMSNGWSSMGFGLPAAIAAKLCLPDTSVCAVVGDGGLLMTVGELATAVREKLNIVVVVLTDNDLALIRIKQERKQNPIFGTPVRSEGTIGGPSLFGVPVVTVSDEDGLREALAASFGAEGPVIVEALVDSREYDELVLHKDKP